MACQAGDGVLQDDRPGLLEGGLRPQCEPGVPHVAPQGFARHPRCQRFAAMECLERGPQPVARIVQHLDRKQRVLHPSGLPSRHHRVHHRIHLPRRDAGPHGEVAHRHAADPCTAAQRDHAVRQRRQECVRPRGPTRSGGGPRVEHHGPTDRGDRRVGAEHRTVAPACNHGTFEPEPNQARRTRREFGG